MTTNDAAAASPLAPADVLAAVEDARGDLDSPILPEAFTCEYTMKLAAALLAEHERAERLEREHVQWVRDHQADTDAAWRAAKDAYRLGWIAAQEAAAKECELVEEAWCNNPRGYLNEYETGRVNSAIDCASAIRALTPPDAPTGEKGE